MKLSDGITQAYQRKWTLLNTFSVQFILGSLGSDSLLGDGGSMRNMIKDKGLFDIESNDINLNIVGVQTPDFTSEPIEVFIANKWVIANGKDNVYKFSMTFRDQDQFLLYKTFLVFFKESKNRYFDDVKMTVVVKKDADWAGQGEVTFLKLEDSLIESVSNLDLKTDSDAQVAEFTVNFKCSSPNL